MRIISVILVIVLVSACASLERERYFKLENADPSRSNPNNFRFKNSELAIGGQFYVRSNATLTTYLGGIIVPFLPVYIFPDMRPNFNEEPLKVTFYAKGLIFKKEEFRKARFDPPSVVVDGKRLLSEKTEVIDGHSFTYYYPVMAHTVESFVVEETAGRLPDGESITTPRVHFRFSSRLHYHCCENMAP